jgi:hypothetical protein
VKHTVQVTAFEDDGAHWVRLTERRAAPDEPNALPYLGKSITFCGNTPDEARQRAVDFVRNATAALEPKP